MLKVNHAELRRQLTKNTGATGSLHDPQLILFTDPPGGLPAQPAVADLHVPTFTGYAAVSPASWGAVGTNAQGQAETVGPASTFLCTADGALNTIYGAALLDTAAANVVAIDVFDVPEVIQHAGDGFTYVPRWALGSPS